MLSLLGTRILLKCGETGVKMTKLKFLQKEHDLINGVQTGFKTKSFISPPSGVVSAVQCSAVQCSAVQCSAVSPREKKFGAPHFTSDPSRLNLSKNEG
jgi:hypothetical protein